MQMQRFYTIGQAYKIRFKKTTNGNNNYNISQTAQYTCFFFVCFPDYVITTDLLGK